LARGIRRYAVGGVACALIAGSARSQDYQQQEIYRATLNGVFVRISAASDRGLEVSAGKPPDHVMLSAVLTEKAESWADSGSRVLSAPDTIVRPDSATHGHEPVTLSSGMLQDSAHSGAALDRVVSDSTAPCRLFFVDGANLNHVRAEVPCGTAREFLAALKRGAAVQAGFERADPSCPAALAAKALREANRRADSLAIAARLTHHKDSAAGAIP
jgi:hypothetical protein